MDVAELLEILQKLKASSPEEVEMEIEFLATTAAAALADNPDARGMCQAVITTLEDSVAVKTIIATAKRLHEKLKEED